MSEDKTDVLRLPKKHATKTTREVTAADGARLVSAQSLRRAVLAGVVAVVVFCTLWSMLSLVANRIFPWLTLLLGLLVGYVVRRAGHGIDWRFPVLAAALAVVGSLAGNVVVAAAFTAAEFDTGTLQILGAVTSLTWPVFFAEVMTPADAVYAVFAAAFAAFFANRRLTRTEYLALRKHEASNVS
jgi:hypothetical protein